MIMYKRALTLILFTSIFFFTTVSYAEDNSLKALMAQVSAAHNKVIALQKENKELKEKLAVKEKEIVGYRATLEKLEEEIAALRDGE